MNEWTKKLLETKSKSQEREETEKKKTQAKDWNIKSKYTKSKNLTTYAVMHITIIRMLCSCKMNTIKAIREYIQQRIEK